MARAVKTFNLHQENILINALHMKNYKLRVKIDENIESQLIVVCGFKCYQFYASPIPHFTLKRSEYSCKVARYVLRSAINSVNARWKKQ